MTLVAIGALRVKLLGCVVLRGKFVNLKYGNCSKLPSQKERANSAD